MFRSILIRLNLGKIALVLFLTVLIWVWADLALDETPPARVAVVKVEESGSEAIWASFSQQSSVEVKVTLSGPHSAFVALDGQLRSENKKLTFVFDTEAERMTEPPGRSLNLLDFLQKAKSLKDLGLKVESCVPESVDVEVVALVKKTLPVECFKEDGQSVTTQSIEPSKVEMFAPETIRSAQVRLSSGEIEQAKLTAIEKTPYIVLAEGRTRSASAPVKIKIPTAQSLLADYSISPATLSIALSPALREKYTAEVTNLTQVLGPIAIKASAEAKRAYEMQALPQMTLYIFDDDAKKADVEQSRTVVYNFPDQFVRKGEIELKNPSQPAEAKFKLIRLASGESAPAVID